MTEFEILAVETAMKKLFAASFFDIQIVRQCLKIAGVIPDERIMQSLSVLHCIHYGDMPKELLEKLPDTIMQLFNGVRLQANFDRVLSKTLQLTAH